MSGWALVAIIAIVVWGIVQLAKARAGITTDNRGNEVFNKPEISPETQARAEAEAEETRREIEQLRERLQVLERIATDTNSEDARERARIAAEIEALRVPNGSAKDGGTALTSEDDGKEQNL